MVIMAHLNQYMKAANMTNQARFTEFYKEVGVTFAVTWAKEMAISAAQIQLWVIQLTKGVK